MQADKLVSKSVFPPNANNNEMARHLYYLGKYDISTLYIYTQPNHLVRLFAHPLYIYLKIYLF